jgi:hypothetical protein
MPADRLRPPTIWDAAPERYKDWLHLNLFDHASGTIGLINASLHGSPSDPRSRVIGTAVANLSGGGWVGNLEILGFSDASIGVASIGLPGLALALDEGSRTVVASVRDPHYGWEALLAASAQSQAINIEEPLPLAEGWISWRVLPRMRAAGSWTVDGQRMNLEQASVYHDHNWGRWFWGDDFGWEWGCFAAQESGVSFVVARTTNRAHTKRNGLSLVVDFERERRTLGNASIALQLEGRISVRRRLPGAMAALHQDMAHPSLPGIVNLRASDGFDEFALQFTAREALQLIAADPIVANGFTFIHEIAGRFSYSAKLGRQRLVGDGLGIFEYVG